MIFLTACNRPEIKDKEEKVDITVSAAASMTDSLLELKKNFEKTNPNIQVNYNFGGSGTLRKQIEQGAPIDLFLSASESDYQLLNEKGVITEGKAILQNQLVLIKPENGDIESLSDLEGLDGKIAIGTPDAVPAGTYAKQALETGGLWGKLHDHIVFTKDVRQVLTFVKEGSVDAGFVYRSDMIQEDKIQLVEEIDSSYHTPIRYYLGIIDHHRDEEKKEAVGSFFSYVTSVQNMELFMKYGFKDIHD